jgi:hypothetical protein
VTQLVHYSFITSSQASETPADNNAATGGAQQGEQIEKQASSGATSEFATPEKPAKEEGNELDKAHRHF